MVFSRVNFNADWPRRWIIASSLMLSGALCATAAAAAAADAPQLVLWAWARSEDLRFIDPQHTGVAFLARTVQVNGDAVRVTRRRHPLRVPPGTQLTAVAHFVVATPELGALPRAVEAVLELTKAPDLVGVQIDFEATPSQRFFYRELVRQVRQGMPAGQVLSATALASWCLFDRWLDGLPVDEVVPMAFSMGEGDAEVRTRLSRNDDFFPSYCRQAAGVSMQESWPPFPSPRRIYAFNSRAWQRADYQRLRTAFGVENIR